MYSLMRSIAGDLLTEVGHHHNTQRRAALVRAASQIVDAMRTLSEVFSS